jgi:TRAP-type mannitol/chloroaromatic compound transport system permease small subunit
MLQVIDSISDIVGRMARWLLPACLGVVFFDVFLRYVFQSATIWVYDMAIFFYAGNFLLAGAYVLRHHSHIRVDVIYNLLSQRGRAIVESCFYIVITIPFMAIMIYAGIVFAADSWMSLETSPYTVWHPPVYPIKTVIPIAYLLLLLQAIAELIRNLRVAVRGEEEQ